jgi:beta-lactamase class A
MLPQVLSVALATAAACSTPATKADIEKVARDARGKLGVSVAVEGQTEFAFHGSRHFPMQSVYKLPIAIAVLHGVEESQLELNRTVHVQPEQLIPPAGHSPLREKFPEGGEFTVEDLLRRAIVDSDGSASDVLLRLIGGPKVVQRFLKQNQLKSVNVKHTEAQIIEDTKAQYQDSATPEGMTSLLTRLQEGKLLNSENTKRILEWMRETETGRDRIRAKLPAGTAVDKTGSSGTSEGLTPATNDVGLVVLPDGKTMAIAIFLSDSKANSATRNRALADVAKEMWDCVSEGTK